MSIDKLDDFLKKYKHELSNEALADLNQIFKEMDYLQKAFDYNPCTISLIDENGIYVNANSEMLKLVNLPKHQFLGTQLGALTKDATIQNLIQSLKESDDLSKHIVIETAIDNQKRVFFITANKVGDKVLTTGLDITATTELEEEKLFNDKMAVLGEMSSFIVHEINNPLSAISMANELVQFHNEDELNNDGKIKQYTEQIAGMIDAISKIIDSLKTVTRKPSHTFSPVSLQSVFDRSKVILSGKLKKHHLQLFNENLEAATINADEGDLIQVMVNLISNSVDAIQDLEKKWIKVKWENEELIIQDSGSGIPEAISKNLFKKFHTSKGTKGNGIGLFLSRDLLRKWKYDMVYRLEDSHTAFVWTPLKNK